MFQSLLLFTPVLICVFWAFMHLLMASRTDQFPTLFTLMIVAAVYLFTDACYVSLPPESPALVKTGLLAQFVAPCVMPLACIYIRKLKRDFTQHPLAMMWIIAPVILFTASVLLTYLAGAKNVGQFSSEIYTNGIPASEPYRGTVIYVYFVISTFVFRAVLAVEMIWLVITIVRCTRSENLDLRHIFRFFKGRRTSVLELQIFNISLIAVAMSPKILLSKTFIDQHQWILALLAVVASCAISNFCHMALMGAKKGIHIKDLRDMMRFNYKRSQRSEVVKQMVIGMIEDMEEQDLMIVQDKIAENLNIETWRESREKATGNVVGKSIFNTMAVSTYGSDSLITRFQELMTEEQIFLDPRIGLTEVAERLHTNKTYISKLVNNTYKLGFPELVNNLRVEYAEQYIINHRKAKQTEIAAACGFLSASSFNNTFKRVTGTTPKLWLAGIDKQIR